MDALWHNNNISQEERDRKLKEFNTEIKKFKKRVFYGCILIFIGSWLLLRAFNGFVVDRVFSGEGGGSYRGPIQFDIGPIRIEGDFW